MPMSDAWSAETQTMMVKEAVGKVAADRIIPFPPGQPLLYYGEQISKELCDFVGPETLVKVVQETCQV